MLLCPLLPGRTWRSAACMRSCLEAKADHGPATMSLAESSEGMVVGMDTEGLATGGAPPPHMDL